MTQEIPSLYPELVETVTPPGKGQHGYYKRGDNGWIITAPAWPTFRNDLEFKGCHFLDRYGTFLYDMPGNRTVFDVNGRNYSPVTEPWRAIFQKGGVREFPLEQIIAYRWHLRPPYREVKFPQLEGVRIYDLYCPECEKGIFSSEREQEAIEMLRVHLTSRINDQHTYRPEDLRALGEEYEIDFFAPRRGRRPVKTAAVLEEEPEPSAPDLSPSEAFICLDCEAQFSTRIALVGHRRSHKVAAPA